MGATLLALGLSCSSDPGPTWSSCAGRVDAGRDPGHPAEPSAIDALDRVAKAHVDAWRAANNMQEESDFAFAFSTFEGAQTAGGVFLLEVQYSILKSLISTCVLSYVGSREDWLLDRICES